VTLTMIYKIQKHMDPEELEKYSMGDLPDAEAARIEEHLLVCEACRQRVAGTDDYVASMSRAARAMRQKQIDPRWRFAAMLAAAACFLVLVGVALRGPVTRPPEVAVSLMAMRANGIGATAPAGRLMRLQPDLTGLDQGKPYRVEVVDRNGGQVWSGQLVPPQDSVRVAAQARGLYFVRISSAGGELLREYGLDVK
jgi:anti-sigma factor RsiW